MIKIVTNQIKDIAALKGITPEEAAKEIGNVKQAGEEYEVDNTRHEDFVNAALREAKEKVIAEVLRAERLEKLDDAGGKKEQLVTRKRVNWTISNDVVDMLKKLSEETGTPISRLIDKAVIEVYGKG